MPVVNQAGHRRVQSAGAEADRSSGSRLDVENNPVAVAVVIDQC
jgi:hypothetical protein